jgi:hypothetical protein
VHSHVDVGRLLTLEARTGSISLFSVRLRRQKEGADVSCSGKHHLNTPVSTTVYVIVALESGTTQIFGESTLPPDLSFYEVDSRQDDSGCGDLRPQTR